MKEAIRILKHAYVMQDALARIGELAIEKGRDKDYPYLPKAVGKQREKCNEINSAIELLASKH